MMAPACMAIGAGVSTRKLRKGGVMRCRFAASEKKAKTSGSGRGSHCVVVNS